MKMLTGSGARQNTNWVSFFLTIRKATLKNNEYA